MWRSSLCIVFIVALAVAGVRAAEADAPEPLVTDRPDITESSRVVGAATLQIETSALWRRFVTDAGESRIFSTPTLLRLGVSRSIELRVATEAYSALRETTSAAADVEHSSGLSPFVLGAKYHLTPASDDGVSVGLIAFAEVPSGSSSFKTRYVTGGLILAADGELSSRVSLGANAGLLVFDDGETDPRGAGSLSAALGFGLSDRATCFAEVASGGVGLGESDRYVVVDAGLTFLLNAGAQLDAALGGGITEGDSPDFFATVGFSCRLSFKKSSG